MCTSRLCMPEKRSIHTAVIVGLVLAAPAAFSQIASSISPPAYNLLRYEEDYSYLRDSTLRVDPWDGFKYIPLSVEGNHYLSLGGETRFQYEYFHNAGWGEGPQDDNGYLLQRYMLHTDLHLGNSFRTFVQIKSGLENGRNGGPRVPDEDQLDLHQAFVDGKMRLAEGANLTLRVGRQELLYGSQRLVSVREGPNVRQSFDAARLILTVKNWRFDGFISRPVATNAEVFDDASNSEVSFWGIYGAGAIPKLKIQHIDFYYLGLDRAAARYEAGVMEETRHSAGLRYWGNKNSLHYNFELVYQWGGFGGGSIDAWTISSDTEYGLESLPLSPVIGLQAEIISGDRNADDNKLQTFNPLFPRGAYFGLAALIGPANLFDMHPSIEFKLNERLTFAADWDFFWRHSGHDGIYGANGAFERTGQTSQEKFIGDQLGLQLAFDYNRHASLSLEGAFFNAGRYLKESGSGKNLGYFSATLGYKF